jgi:hypothetical protein
MKSPVLSLSWLLATRKRCLTSTARPVRPRVEELEPRLVLSPPTPEHVVLVIEENHGYAQIIGSPSAPYINGLASQGALMTNSFAIEHPSQPNYLDLFSGSNQGITDDSTPHYFSTPNLGGELLDAGLTFAGYSEDLPSPGYLGDMSGHYGRNHNPWVDFTELPPEATNQPFQGYFPSDFSQLPTVSIVVPSKIDDMHDGMDPARIQAGDTWLQNNIDAYVQWAYANNSLLIVTFDEDNNMQGNHIATLVVGPMVQSGQYDEAINHYTLLRTIEDMYGLPYAGHSADVDPIMDIWAPVTAQATHFAVTTPVSSATAGDSLDVTVTALDANNNPVPGYTGTVHFTSADPYGAMLPADYTFTADDNGTHIFPAGAALYTAGTWDVTATDTASGVTGQAFVAVNPAVADHVLFLQQPTDTPAGQMISPAVTVAVVDQFGNVETSDDSDAVTLAIGNNPNGGTLSGTLTVTVSGGIATFSDLSIDQIGDGYTLLAAADGLGFAESNRFSITM